MIIGAQQLKKTFMGLNIDLLLTDLHSEKSHKKIFELWQQFMSIHYKNIVKDAINENIVSIAEPSKNHNVIKWAAVEIKDQELCQYDKLNFLTIQGKYYGFTHIGKASEFNKTYQEAVNYLNNKNILIDLTKPKFEIMHRSYLPDDPASQEEFWLPVK